MKLTGWKKGLVFLLSLLIGSSALNAAPSQYDARWNEKRIKEITEETLKLLKEQLAAYRAEQQPQSSDPNNGMMGPGMMGPGMPGGPSQEPPKPKKPFTPNVTLITAEIKKKFPARIEDSLGPMPLVDARSKIDLQDAVRAEVRRQFDADIEKLTAQEIKDAEEMYPLYKPNDNVELRFAIGHETPRTYRGRYKTIGKYKITIGPHTLSRADLPEIIKPRFDAKLNEEARRKYVAKHPLLTKHELEFETALASRVKEMLNQQFVRNLPHGWIYINEAWCLPEDIVADVLQYHMAAQGGRRNSTRMQKTTGIYGGAN